MKKTILAISTLALFASTACGGDDISLTPDAPPVVRTDAAPSCTVLTGGYGDVGTLNTGDATVGPQMQTPTQDFILFSATVNQDAQPDGIIFSFWEGFGAFPSDFATPSYPLVVPIAGDETAFATCGTCVEFVGDVVNGAGTQSFMAQSGSITVTSLDPTPGTGRIVGSITDITFAHVDDDGMVINDNCSTSVAAMAFDLPIVMR